MNMIVESHPQQEQSCDFRLKNKIVDWQKSNRFNNQLMFNKYSFFQTNMAKIIGSSLSFVSLFFFFIHLPYLVINWVSVKFTVLVSQN